MWSSAPGPPRIGYVRRDLGHISRLESETGGAGPPEDRAALPVPCPGAALPVVVPELLAAPP
jgi:hypothetical protein